MKLRVIRTISITLLVLSITLLSSNNQVTPSNFGSQQFNPTQYIPSNTTKYIWYVYDGFGPNAAASLANAQLMQQKIEASEPHDGDAFQEPIAVARSLEEALRLLGEDNDLRNVLGADFVKAYGAVKLEEFEAFNKVISSWERKYLLLNV